MKVDLTMTFVYSKSFFLLLLILHDLGLCKIEYILMNKKKRKKKKIFVILSQLTVHLSYVIHTQAKRFGPTKVTKPMN